MTLENGTDSQTTGGEDAFTRGTRIGDARRIAESPCLVRESDGLREVAEALSVQGRVHTVAVVDAAGTLVGIIPLQLLVDELFLQVAPEEFLTDILDSERMEEYGRLVRAHSAAELMQTPVFVTVDDTIGDAFALMHDHELEGLPVVDQDLRPIGYLDRLELIRVWLQGHPPASAGSPS